jgi:TolB-like protein
MDSSAKMLPPNLTSTSLAVLPFENLSGDPAQDYFLRGFAMDLVTELCRFSSLQLISPQTSFTLNSDNDSFQDIIGTLNIDYLLSGGIRRFGNTLRINTKLVDSQNNQIVWAERYNALDEALFELQDNIVAQVANVLSLKIDTSRLQKIRSKPTAELAAYDCWLRGSACLQEATLEADSEARLFFDQALTIDPDFSKAYAGLSLSYFNEWNCQHWANWDENEEKSYEYAMRASNLDENDHISQLVLGKTLLFRKEFAQAKECFEKALSLNPNDTNSLIQIGGYMTYLGRHEEALELVQKALRLNPYCETWYYTFAALPYFHLQRYDEVFAMVAKASGPSFVDLPAYVACAHAYRGDLNEAARFLTQFKNNYKEKITFGREPEEGEALRWVMLVNPFKHEADAERLANGLIKAGLDGAFKEVSVKLQQDNAEFTSSQAALRSNDNVLRAKGDTWEISYGAETVYLSEVKGFHDLKLLLSNANEEIHCSDLMGIPISQDKGDTTIDAQARSAYENRIRELQEELEEAEGFNDLGRIELLREELDQVVDHLSKALGLSGRTRKLSAPSDRARSAVTWRIRHAILKIESAHTALGKHFKHTIKTGTYCSYQPEIALLWLT